jgi:hypothetical protein
MEMPERIYEDKASLCEVSQAPDEFSQNDEG